MSYSLITSADGLRELLLENPELPIVVLAGEEANSGDYNWMFCSYIKFEIREILDCDYRKNDEIVFCDRGEFEDYIADELYHEYCDKPDSEYDAAIRCEIEKYEPYWKKVIAICATN